MVFVMVFVMVAFTKKNGETWGKVQTYFSPSLPPSTWQHLIVISHICIVGYMLDLLFITFYIISMGALQMQDFCWSVINLTLIPV